MDKLELKVLPLLLVVIFAVLMWLVAKLLPNIELSITTRYAILAATSLFALSITLAGALAFKRSNTTVNPIKPETASSLVTNGAYQWTRNPMYLGFATFLVGWSLFLSSLYALSLIVGFVLYMNRFQIEPEERALEGIFGETFLSYKKQVRRWI